MTNDSERDSESEQAQHLPLRTSEIGFQPDEMIACERCSKPNPPNRALCLYCGTAIGDPESPVVEVRGLESWENGFNVVIVDASAADLDRAANHMAVILHADKEDVLNILEAGGLPLARLESEDQADAVVKKLGELSIEATVASDKSLADSPVRLRSISFGEAELEMELFGSGERISIERGDVGLILRGALFATRSEVIEKRKFRGNKPVSEMEVSSDEPVIDIYSKTAVTGWRIPSSGFDFSCLGDSKALTVGENMKRLIEALTELAPEVDVDDDYLRCRPILETVWPSESRHEKQDIGLGRKQISRTSKTNNLIQWNKYSRLRRHLYETKV